MIEVLNICRRCGGFHDPSGCPIYDSDVSGAVIFINAPSAVPGAKKTFTEDPAIPTIYLMCARKQGYDVPEGWKEVAWDRGNYIECGIYQKPISEMSSKDWDVLETYGHRPEGWIEPERTRL